MDPATPADIAGLETCFDTVLCINIFEYLDQPAAVLHSLRSMLKANGALVILAPHSRRLFGMLDRSLGHKRRYDVQELRAMLEAEGLSVEKAYTFNRAGTLPWWAYSRIFGKTSISKPVLKLFDKTVWLWRRVDRLMPWPGLSLIVVGRKGAGVQDEPSRQERMPEVTSPNA
jgi:hypothetical protein